MEYLERIADAELKRRLSAMGAVYIKGPKWCGKSTTAAQQAKSMIWLQDPDKRAEYQATGQTTPSILLRGENPRLIDEWQDIPLIWDAVRMEVDRHLDRFQCGGHKRDYAHRHRTYLTYADATDESLGIKRVHRRSKFAESVRQSRAKYRRRF